MKKDSLQPGRETLKKPNLLEEEIASIKASDMASDARRKAEREEEQRLKDEARRLEEEAEKSAALERRRTGNLNYAERYADALEANKRLAAETVRSVIDDIYKKYGVQLQPKHLYALYQFGHIPKEDVYSRGAFEFIFDLVDRIDSNGSPGQYVRMKPEWEYYFSPRRFHSVVKDGENATIFPGLEINTYRRYHCDDWWYKVIQLANRENVDFMDIHYGDPYESLHNKKPFDFLAHFKDAPGLKELLAKLSTDSKAMNRVIESALKKTEDTQRLIDHLNEKFKLKKKDPLFFTFGRISEIARRYNNDPEARIVWNACKDLGFLDSEYADFREGLVIN